MIRKIIHWVKLQRARMVIDEIIIDHNARMDMRAAALRKLASDVGKNIKPGIKVEILSNGKLRRTK